jgi:short subunit dehydrogenase-like uncharacterized protein
VSDWLLYGANGYTGRLIAREAVGRGLRPILAGRDRAAISELAKELGCPSCTFALDGGDTMFATLTKAVVVLNCAGPFSKTADILITACDLTCTSYLDITGEIEVIERAARWDPTARKSGISIIPAVGFDVVPTDCLAAILASELPDATYLTLAFTGSGVMSPGTMKTVLEGMPHGGRVRRDGRIERVPALWKTRSVPFPSCTREVVMIPWGDIASAFHTTGIPNIETYMAMPPRDLVRMRRSQWFAPLLKVPFILTALQRYAARRVIGPNDAELASGRAEIWGEVCNTAGRSMSAALTTPNAYRLTALTAVAAVERVLRGNVAPGFHTPARAFGKEFVLSVPGVVLRGPA